MHYHALSVRLWPSESSPPRGTTLGIGWWDLGFRDLGLGDEGLGIRDFVGLGLRSLQAVAAPIMVPFRAPLNAQR